MPGGSSQPVMPPQPPELTEEDVAAVFELNVEDDDEDLAEQPPALYQAICLKSPAQVLQVLQHSCAEEVTATHGHTRYTYLHLLVMVVQSGGEGTGSGGGGSAALMGDEEKCLPIVYQLSNAGADVNAADSTGATALQMAISKNLTQIMVALIRCGVDLCDRDYKAMVQDVKSPLEAQMLDILDKYQPGMWAAVGSGSTGIVNLLINSWCRVNIHKRLPNNAGNMSLLMYAQRGRQPSEMISILDDYEVTIEFVHATLAGDEIRMQDFLMDSKPCDPYIMDISYQETSDAPLIPRSLRDAAISMGHTHVLHLLPEGDYDSGPKSRIIKEANSEGIASCSDYSSGGSNGDSVNKIETVTNHIQTDTQFMTIGRAPRLSTFSSEPITSVPPDTHYVQGFFFHEPEQAEEEHVFQGDTSFLHKASPMGTMRSRGNYSLHHDYSKNWDVEAANGGKANGGKANGGKANGGKKNKEKDSKSKTKSKLCVIM